MTAGPDLAPWRGTRQAGVARAYLHPGAFFVSASPVEVTTILGTCVSVFLWDPHARVGGVNHWLLPMVVGETLGTPRFGVVAMPALLRQVIALGASPQRLQAKVFGGMKSQLESAVRKGVGTANVELALRLLEEEGIPVVAQSTGGPRGRKVVFDFNDGGVWVKEL